MAVLRRINLLSLHDEHPDVRHASSEPWNGRESDESDQFGQFDLLDADISGGIENPIPRIRMWH